MSAGAIPSRHRDRQVVLADGTRVAYWEFGSPDGVVVMALHGMPICGLCFAPLDRPAERAGIRLLAPDRPGTGHSSVEPGHTVAGWTATLARFADGLGVECFGVIGWSSGGPFALACGARLADRLLGLAVVGGIAPIADDPELRHYTPGDRDLFSLARARPAEARRVIADVVAEARASRETALEQFTAELNERDRALVASLGPVDEAFAFFPATVRGPAGFADGVVAVSAHWGFELDDVRHPVHLFVGDADTVVAPAVAHDLLRRLPRARLSTLPGEGHLLIYTHPDAVLRAAIESACA